jgi:hypothetical protein
MVAFKLWERQPHRTAGERAAPVTREGDAKMPYDVPTDSIHLAPDTTDLGADGSAVAAGSRQRRYALGVDTPTVDLSTAGLALIGLHRRPRPATSA